MFFNLARARLLYVWTENFMSIRLRSLTANWTYGSRPAEIPVKREHNHEELKCERNRAKTKRKRLRHYMYTHTIKIIICILLNSFKKVEKKKAKKTPPRNGLATANNKGQLDVAGQLHQKTQLQNCNENFGINLCCTRFQSKVNYCCL